MFYATYNTSGQSSTLESTTDYYDNDLGNVTRAVTDKENNAPGERRFGWTWLGLREEWIGGWLFAGHFAT